MIDQLGLVVESGAIDFSSPDQGTAGWMGYLRDPRHRYSYELRPCVALDRALRAVALELETSGLVEAGAATAVRFQPHLTLARAASGVPAALDAARCRMLAEDPGFHVTLDQPATFGSGRIVYLAPVGSHPLVTARMALVGSIEASLLDPVVLTREWTPHVTVAYETCAGRSQDAIRHLERVAPLEGTWGSLECWDLSVRPTVLVHRVELARSG